jgi:hypothetical protein
VSSGLVERDNDEATFEHRQSRKVAVDEQITIELDWVT